jgi:hypothetical protein
MNHKINEYVLHVSNSRIPWEKSPSTYIHHQRQDFLNRKMILFWVDLYFLQISWINKNLISTSLDPLTYTYIFSDFFFSYQGSTNYVVNIQKLLTLKRVCTIFAVTRLRSGQNWMLDILAFKISVSSGQMLIQFGLSPWLIALYAISSPTEWTEIPHLRVFINEFH